MIYAVTSTPGTGQIEGVYRITEESVAGYTALDALFFTEEPDVTGKYRSGNELLPRPILSGFDKLNITADDEDTASITLPEGTVVGFNGEVFTIEPDDLVLEITADVAGTYVVEVNPPWPWVAETYTIEATDPEP